jgi:hypothetical protein
LAVELDTSTWSRKLFLLSTFYFKRRKSDDVGDVFLLVLATSGDSASVFGLLVEFLDAEDGSDSEERSTNDEARSDERAEGFRSRNDRSNHLRDGLKDT